ncbi:hypothetical protein [Piscibacillus halophilus]|uniref:Uncharacterized protein n=1 Tax=Piscibacillus halophilus TaxID=571933 RepID=A0A1H9HWD4_9BACI|nr:hypothetical protein [Piscibacillus halophilus]SEQ66634.1 hypothetical protein SAMN05216362_12138 [Piscibacillus halophilus]
MPIHILVVELIGVLFIYLGFLILNRKAPTFLDFVLKIGVTYTDKISNRFWGGLMIVVGLIIMLMPLILGAENMNI